MGRVTVEWMVQTASGPAWKRVETRLKESRRGNCYFTFYPEEGPKLVCVVNDWKLGSEVLGKTPSGWKPVGRVARGPGGHLVFIGEGESFEEHMRRKFEAEVAAGGHLISQEELRESEPLSRW